MAKRTIICLLLLLLMLTAAVPAKAETEAASPFLPCDVVAPVGREAFAGNLTDGDYATRFTLTAGQALSVGWTGEAEGVMLQWYDVRYRATINLYDPEGKRLSSTAYPFMQYRMFLPAAGASRMEILCPRGGTNVYASLCEVQVYAAGHEPACLTRVEPVDLMLVLSGVSEELDLMGGLLPLYAGEHRIRTAVVYVGVDDGNQIQEAFHALEKIGADVIPVFLLRDDQATCSIDRMAGLWGEAKLKETLASLFRQYAPKVVVTCDPTDRFSRVRTPYTGRLVTQILTGTQNGKLPVQKFYHLSRDGGTLVDWTKPLAAYGGRTAQEVAQEGYACYDSEASFGTIIPENSRFVLAFSQVGEDEGRNDLFEHILTESLLWYEAPTPIPTATPTPEPTREPTPEPTATPELTATPTVEPTKEPTPEPTEAPTAAPTVAPTAVPEKKAGAVLGLSGGQLALYALSGAALVLALFQMIKKKKRALALFLLIAAGLLAYMGYWLIDMTPGATIAEAAASTAAPTEKPTPKPTPEPTKAPTPEPTKAPTPGPTEVPTAEPTEAPTPEPTPTPDPDARYFRQEGESAEVVVQDYENGHWEYRSDILSVIIDRQISKEDNKPYCKYIAHIRMRKVNSYRSIVSSHYAVATAAEPPWRLARNFKAVLAITGDNINNEDVPFKGILIRRGILYSDMAGEDTLVIRDDMTMDILHRGEEKGVDLLDSGVLATYSFGPTLVENYSINPDVARHRVFRENPRCGIGMVEPGHFVAIVTDGRDARRAYGYTLDQFAEIFQREGVKVAYNLDGGASAAMVFMGEHVNWQSGDHQRTWADALAWGYSNLIPLVTDPVLHPGGGDSY